MKPYAIALAAAVLLCSGCGREERREAISLTKMLEQKDVAMAATNAEEKDFLSGTRDWCDGIVANGSGKAAVLDQKIATAKVLAQSAAVVAAQLSTLRQSIYDQPLKQEFTEGVRGVVLRELMDRQKRLQDVRAALEESAATFLQFEQSRNYTGEAYPAGIGKLSSTLSGYTGPTDPLIKAIADLKANYNLKDAEIAVPAPPKAT